MGLGAILAGLIALALIFLGLENVGLFGRSGRLGRVTLNHMDNRLLRFGTSEAVALRGESRHKMSP